MYCYIYLISNKDWLYEKKYKYGYSSENILNRLSSEQHSYLSTFKHIFKLEITKEYKLRYKEIDKIFSRLSRNIKKIKRREKKYKIKLPLLKNLCKLNYLINNSGGTEFIKEDGIKLLIRIIKEEFILIGINFVKEYSSEELKKINYDYINKYSYNETQTSDSELEDDIIEIKYKPNDIQQEILFKIEKFYIKNNIGKLIWTCGLGKTLMSLFIAKQLKFKKILIGVPSCNLLIQWFKYLNYFYIKENILCISSNKDATTDSKVIFNFMNSKKNFHIIITTYSSCYIISELYKEKVYFDFKIGDEAHHLVNIEREGRQYIKFHSIQTKKTLFMTATEKVISSDAIYTMDKLEIFGQVIDTKNIYWAIENNKITDYSINIIQNTKFEIDNIIKESKISNKIKYNNELFLAAYQTLKSIQTTHQLSHLLIYCNKIEDCILLENYIIELNNKIFKFDSLYNKALYCGLSDINNEIVKFTNNRYGIISCVYILGEGIDIPKLNGVVFASVMNSEIRIIQSALRPHRLEKGNPDKHAYILLPYLKMEYDVPFSDDEESFKKIRQIISHIGNCDEGIIQRIKFKKLKDSKRIRGPNKPKIIYERKYKCDEGLLNLIKLKLIHRKALQNSLTKLMNEFNYMKELIKFNKINTIQKYKIFESKNPELITSPEKHFELIWEGWYNYLDIDTSKFLTLERWIDKCNELKITSLDDYEKKSPMYEYLPDEPDQYYKPFRGIERELNLVDDSYLFS